MAPRLTDLPSEGAPAKVVRRVLAGLDGVWRTLRRPWLLTLVVLLLLALLLAARAIPQMPGQAQEDPASAQRWLNAEAETWGRSGSLLRLLGLFGVLQSPLFYALAGAVALLGAIHLADAIRFVFLPGRLRALFRQDPTGYPLPVVAPERVYRRRVAVSQPQEQVTPKLSQWMATAFDASVEHATVTLPSDEDGTESENRLLVQKHPRLVWLRPLIPLALLLSSAGLWLNALWGWDVRPETLAPGAQVVYAPHAVNLAYGVEIGSTGDATAVISGTVAGEPIYMALTGSAQRASGVEASVNPGALALWITAQERVLALPGEDDLSGSVGLLFAQTGSEQLVVLPRDNAGLRVVRLGGESAGAFLVEVFAEGAVQPVERVQTSAAQTVTVPTGDTAVELALLPVPAIDLEVRRSPGDWFIWPALALALAGLAGAWFRPAFALAQVRPWPVGRSVVTLQASRPLPAELPLEASRSPSMDESAPVSPST